MKSIFRRFSMIAMFAVFVVPVFAQEPSVGASKYVVSAKAGGVNLVEGSVGVVRARGLSGVLVKGDVLTAGERVSTGPDGKTEILLNPGSYVRLGGNAAFEFRSTDLEDLQLVLHRGSAIFEVFASEDYPVDLIGPDTRFVVVDSGVFRMDVVDGKSSLSVWKGKARVGSETGELLKGGRETRLDDGEVIVAKFDRDEKDELDLWSRQRSKELAKMVASLDRTTVRRSLMSSFGARQWNLFDSFGLWIYDPFRASYCFLPFGYGWSSPYGFGYNRYLDWYNFPPIYYYPRNPGGSPSTPTTGGGSPNTPPSTVIAEPRQRGARVPQQAPPFVQMQRQEGRSRPTFNDSFPSSQSSGGVFIPQTPSAPSKSDSAPSKRP